jgi:hypothetical protein
MAFDPPQKLGDDAGEGAPNAPTASGATPGTPIFRQTVGAILPEPQRGFNLRRATAVLDETWGLTIETGNRPSPRIEAAL